MKIIAHIKNDFTSKFGIPRQSGLVPEMMSQIIFEPEFRNPDAIRGLEDFSHLWLIWNFSQSKPTESLTVRPPRLGGNKRMGVFATRSPFRPNPIGLSCVKIEKIEIDADLGPVISVLSADLMDGTPIYDIKPYIPYADCIPNAVGGFADNVKEYRLNVNMPSDICGDIDEKFKSALYEILANDPRPSYQNEPERIYSFEFGGYKIRFKADEKNLTLTELKKL
ncbi:MAG: tRNA (N6-threonylcarbamoyladenosine(37)-N6)-methyltransferase TrmO [Oscillospiraceae bacterium]|nr:tRNA (N6-threonylcarbamoyladenosine(37)-N6)-methyltransferase TrmO [Ruminococcus sp.]MDY6060569.1 tRNA (N6-threonylcarbamoyladenosine(37)-N6)-methyltransferase TrmO [Oscillospiraceae bacterium]